MYIADTAIIQTLVLPGFKSGIFKAHGITFAQSVEGRNNTSKLFLQFIREHTTAIHKSIGTGTRKAPHTKGLGWEITVCPLYIQL